MDIMDAFYVVVAAYAALGFGFAVECKKLNAREKSITKQLFPYRSAAK